MKSSRRGHTLIELSVTGTVLMLGLLMIWGVFDRGLQLLRQGEARSDAGRVILRAAARLAAEVANSPATAVSLTTTADGVVLGYATARDEHNLPLRQPGSTLPLYPAHWVYFRHNEELRRLRVALPLPQAEPAALTTPELILATSAPGSELVVDHCQAFRATTLDDAATSSWVNPLELVISTPGQERRATLRCRLT